MRIPYNSKKKKKVKTFKNYDDVSKYYVYDRGQREPGASLIDNMLKEGNTTASSSSKSIIQNPDKGTNPGRKIMPTTVTNKVATAANLANVDQRRKVFVTKYETGFPPTREVLDAAKEQGVQVKILSDSKIDFRGDDSSTLRNALTHGQGFNLKEYHVPPNLAQVTNTELRSLLFGPDTFPLDENREIDRRSFVMNIKQQFLIKNQSTNLPIIFKIHLVKLLESPQIQNDLGSTFLQSFYDQPELDDETSLPGKIPIWYQFGSEFVENDESAQTLSYNVSTSTKLKNLRKASLNFRKSFEIIETFSHTIKPGDFWNFSHTHNCGAGIDTEMLTQFNVPGDNQPSGMQYATGFLPYTYGIIFETQGKLCEAQVIEKGNADSLYEYNPYIGTSPGQYFYEFKTSINFVRDPESPARPWSVVNITDETSSNSLSSTLALQTKEIRLARQDWREEYENPSEEIVNHYVVPFTSTAIETLGGVTGPFTDLNVNP